MSKIQWTDVTDNPIYLLRPDGSHGGHWCRKESEGCADCYAEAINQSNFFPFASHLPYTGSPPHTLHFDEAIVQAWARARSPKKRFVCSMTDLFGPWVPMAWQSSVLDAAVAAPTQTIQLLTKHPDVMLESLKRWLAQGNTIPPNVWFGITVENRRCARLRHESAIALSRLGCFVWVSYEPALEFVNFVPWFPYIGLIVMGGKSGNNPVACDINWFRHTIENRDRHAKDKVSLFVKQMGVMPYRGSQHSTFIKPDQDYSSDTLIRISDRQGGVFQEFPPDIQVRELPDSHLGVKSHGHQN